MRSLFLKIFLWFWLTMILVGLAWVITWNLQPEVVVSRWRAMVGEAISFYSQSASEELDRYGTAGLDNYLQRLDASGKVKSFLFDDEGHLISGKPSTIATELALHAAQSSETEFMIRPGTAWAARSSVGPSGKKYVFVASMPRGPFAGLRMPWGTQLVRWAVVILVSGFICYLLTRYLTRPILRLRSTARNIAAGELSARAPVKMGRRRDEIGELVRDFNQMAERIDSLVAAQKQLISDVSHELRSPLARLTVALGLARQRAGDEAQPILDRIEREAERLNELIGKLLTIARLGAASEPPERVEVDLAELVEEIVEDASFEAQERPCSVTLKTQPCAIQGSPELLHSAIENVIRNAIRYTAPGSTVEVTLSCEHDSRYAIATVRDHGPGVPDAELVNLFRPFYRLTHARERASGGTGLGLAISDRAVRLHGGTIRAENASGGGLLVVIQLPALRASSQGKSLLMDPAHRIG